jgi:hypothetical protein
MYIGPRRRPSANRLTPWEAASAGVDLDIANLHVGDEPTSEHHQMPRRTIDLLCRGHVTDLGTMSWRTWPWPRAAL